VASVASVTGGTRLLTIADDRTLHLDGLVDENDVAWVEVGQPARVRTEAYPVYQGHQYPPPMENQEKTSYERNNQLIEEAKRSSKPAT
jgi:hypothetical protein